MSGNDIANARRRVMRARMSGPYTDPCSRHLHMMADCLSMGNRQYRMLQDEPDHCALTMYAVLEDLWKGRRELARLKAKLSPTDGAPADQPKVRHPSTNLRL